MTFSYKDLAKYYGVSRSTFTRHLKKLIDTRQFEKTATGDCFNEVDAVKIASLLGFCIPELFYPINNIAGPAPLKKEIISPNQIDLIDSIKEVEQEHHTNKFKFK